MRYFSFLATVALLLVGTVTGRPTRAAEQEYPELLVARTDPLPPEAERAKFHLPPGFEIELVVAEPQIHKPMNLNFDERGRLFVTNSLEYPFPKKPGERGRDQVTVLSQFDAHGRAGLATTLVDGLNICIGVTPVADGVIYYSIPKIFKAKGLEGTVPEADRKVLYSTFGFRDTHGMTNSFTRWIDGWIYACHGFSNDSSVSGADDHKVVMNSGNTFRMRADGSHIEQFTHGQVNPFGLCFDPLGNLYSADCHTKPLYMLLRGAWYPSFSKPDDGLGFGPEMIEHLHGSTGIAGVVYYAAQGFPEEYRGTVFIGNPVTGRINHDKLEPHGSTFKAIEQPDFLSCDDPWFRPVDIKLGPDGALYVADFYNCIIGHYEVPLTHPRRDRERGRIWKITYRGDKPHTVPSGTIDFTKLDPPALIQLLGHENITVRVLATERLVALGKPLPRELFSSKETDDAHAFTRAHAMWINERLLSGGVPENTLATLLADKSVLVRVHALKLLADRSSWSEAQTKAVRAHLEDDNAYARRAAADGLGRHPAKENVELLLKLLSSTPGDDSHLMHVLRMALRDQVAVPGMYQQVADLAKNEDYARRLANVSLGVQSPAAAEFLLSFLSGHNTADQPVASYVHHAARQLPPERLGALYAYVQSHLPKGLGDQRALVVELYHAAQERQQPAPEDLKKWAAKVAAGLLATKDQGQVQQGIELARDLQTPGVRDELEKLADEHSKFPALRPAAIDACVANDSVGSIPLLSRILANSAEELQLRQKAASALANLGQKQAQEVLLAQLRVAPQRLAIDIAAGLAARRETAEALLADIRAGKATAQLLQEPTVRERLRAANLPEMDAQIKQLTENLPPADERLRNLIETRRAGFTHAKRDAAQGRKVYEKTCMACHRINNQGGKVGPDLEGVGVRGSDRLIEDLVDPNRNVDQAFRSTLITTKDGRSLSGLVLREEGQVLVLADQQGKEVRVPLDEIDQRAVGQLSPMPANVVDLVPEPDFYNLLTYLLEQKQTKPPAGK